MATSISQSLVTNGCSLFDFRLFSSLLKTRFLGRSMAFHPAVDSTQTRALAEMTRNTFMTGHLILADRQTEGRGRITGRRWFSPPGGQNLYFTLLNRLENPSALAKMNFCSALSIVEAIHSISQDTVKSSIKWPNDIFIGHQKLSGILIDCNTTEPAEWEKKEEEENNNKEEENTMKSSGKEKKKKNIPMTHYHMAIGIGINIYQRFSSPGGESFATPPISLIEALEEAMKNGNGKNTAGNSIALENLRERVLACFLNQFEENLDLPWNQLLERYTKYSAFSPSSSLSSSSSSSSLSSSSSSSSSSYTILEIFPNRREETEGSYLARFIDFTPDGFLRVQPIQWNPSKGIHQDHGEIRVLISEEVSVKLK